MPQKIATLDPLKPEVLEWTWKPPATANPHSCMLVVMDSASDPIPAANKTMDIGTLVTNEKRAGLKNLQVVDLLPDEPSIVDFHLYSKEKILKLKLSNRPPKNFLINLVLPKLPMKEIIENKRFDGLTPTKIKPAYREKILNYFKEIEYREAAFIKEIEDTFDLETSLQVNADAKRVELWSTLTKGALRVLLILSAQTASKRGGAFSIIQTSAQDEVRGGCTFVLATSK